MTRFATHLLSMAAAAALLASVPMNAQSQIRTERVQFKKGASSAVVQGRIRGYQTVDYIVGARQGQSANVSLGTRHGATYFNILAPGQNEVAFFNGSTSQNQYEGVLPASGDYKIRVYMMRSAARRNEVADYRLEVIVAAAPATAAAPSGDAKVAGTGFHATGSIPYAMGGGQPTASCAFGVTRQGQGNAMVTVTKADGAKRVIFFEKGRATGYDASQADHGSFKVTRQGDLSIIDIGTQRYEIPDAVASGG